MKKYKKIQIERDPNGKFSILIDNKVIASGLTLKDVSKKVEEFLNG
jgi:hypothetical protein